MALASVADALSNSVDAPGRISIRGQSKSSDVGAGSAVAVCDCDPPPNSALTRSPKGTEPDDDDVVPSDFEPAPSVPQPATSTANNATTPARTAQRTAVTRYGVVERIDPAKVP